MKTLSKRCSLLCRDLPAGLCLLLFTPAHSYALNEQMERISGDFLRMIWALLLVIGVILLLYALLRKKFAITGKQQNRAINVLEIRPLMGKKALCLVEIEGRKLLLGLAEHNINLLTTLEQDSTFANTLKEFQHSNPASGYHEPATPAEESTP